MPRSRILSTGMYVPPKVVTNDDLSKLMETSDEWIQKRSGIKQRRWVEEGGDTQLGMGVKAAKQAIERAQVDLEEIDMIIFGALLTDYIFPGTGVLLQRELGFKRNIPALDIKNQCAGFMYAMQIADGWIRAGMYKKILIVHSEIHSTSLDVSTPGRDVTVLFGDGAGAVVVGAVDESEPHLIDNVIYSEGQYAEKLAVVKPSSNDFPRMKKEWQDKEEFPYMEGKLVFKNAVTRMTESMHEVMERNGITSGDVDFVIAHQANMRINAMVLDQLGIPFEKTHHTLDRYGNTTAATIPITLDEAIQEGKVKRGDLVAITAFGSGFVWGSGLFRY